VRVTFPQLVHINSCDIVPYFLLVTLKQLSKRKKVVNQIALTTKQVLCGSKLIK